MKSSYPILLTPEEKGFTVFIPDFNINTQGDDLTEAIEMSRDAIGIMGVDLQDDKKAIPSASAITDIKHSANEIVSLVDVDFDEYRKKNDLRTVKKNCTIPSWLNFEAEKAGVNFSAVLQAALKNELHITSR